VGHYIAYVAAIQMPRLSRVIVAFRFAKRKPCAERTATIARAAVAVASSRREVRGRLEALEATVTTSSGENGDYPDSPTLLSSAGNISMPRRIATTSVGHATAHSARLNCYEIRSPALQMACFRGESVVEVW
jgi:hypothetical protein